jgi:endonuclease/exonuclease/phosphatase family metal-dependent hydrolase
MIKLASYNIRRGLGTDLRRDLSRNLLVIDELDADIVAVQEAHNEIGPSLGLPHHGMAGPGSDYIAASMDGSRNGVLWRGNAVLVRKSAVIHETRHVALPSFEEDRGAIVVNLAIAGEQLRVVATHLALFGYWRERQALALLDWLSKVESQLPTVILGDLNEWRSGGACVGHIAASYSFAQSGRSFPSRWPLMALDRIAATRDVTIHETGVHKSNLARRASDHLPIWASLSLNQK